MGELDIFNLKNRYLFHRYVTESRTRKAFVHPSIAMRMIVLCRYMQHNDLNVLLLFSCT